MRGFLEKKLGRLKRLENSHLSDFTFRQLNKKIQILTYTNLIPRWDGISLNPKRRNRCRSQSLLWRTSSTLRCWLLLWRRIEVLRSPLSLRPVHAILVEDVWCSCVWTKKKFYVTVQCKSVLQLKPHVSAAPIRYAKEKSFAEKIAKCKCQLVTPN